MGQIGQKIIIHTRRILSLVWTRLVHRVDPIRRGDKSTAPRCRARPFIHSRASFAQSFARRGREPTRRVDPIRPHRFVRSHRFVRIDSSTSNSRTELARDRVARSPIRPSVRRVERANRRSRVARSSDLSLSPSRSTSTRWSARRRRNEWIFIRAVVRAVDADATTVDDDDDETTRRDRSTRDVEASARTQEKGGLGSTDRGCG